MSRVSRRDVLAGGASAALIAVVPGVANAAVTAFMQAVAEAASKDRDLAEFYRASGYKPLWTGKGGRDKQRRQAFVKAISRASDHGLPAGRYAPDVIKTNIRGVRSQRDLGRLEVEMSRMFLR